MSANKKSRTFVTAVYWFLLFYIAAALAFWFFELEKQNREMMELRLSRVDPRDPGFAMEKEAIQKEASRKTRQFQAEGITFLVLILLGAMYMYRSVRRQLRLQQQEQNFMMAVTHELKTPIAIAQLNLETLLKHQLDEERRSKLIRMTLQETNRLNQLASNILVSAQLEGRRYRISKDDLDFSSLVNRSAADFSQRFTDRIWKIEVEENIDINGDGFLLEMMVNNLIENAVKYSKKDSKIEIRLNASGSKIILQVADTGEGIPVSERKQIFQKFYRIGSEDTRSTKGTGLGLYICSRIAADHKGKIRVTDNNPKGTLFTISFNR